MACGVPPIAVDAFGPADIVDHGETGWLVEPDDVASLANALVEAVNRPAERRRRGANAAVAAHERYAWPALAEQVAEIYDDGRRRNIVARERRPKRLNTCVRRSNPARSGVWWPAAATATVFASLPSTRMGLRVPPPVARLCLNVPAAGSASTTRPTSTTPAVSPWSPSSMARPVARDRRARDRRAREPRAPRRRGRRSEHGRRRRNPAPAARRVHPRRDRARTCRRPAPTASACASSRATPSRRAELEQLLEQTVRDEGQRVVAWRDVPVDKDYVGITANLYAPYVKQLVVAASDELATDQDAFERKLYVIRRVAEIAAGPELVIPSFSSRTIVYKGMLTSPQLLGYYPGPGRPAHEVRAGARPQPLLHEHVPELGARAPVPDDRPQRRDQHAARQRQLDARARVAARLRAVRRRPAEGAAGRAPGRQRQRHVRQRARAARAGRPQPPARGDDDDPGGLRGPRRPARGPARASTPSTRA